MSREKKKSRIEMIASIENASIMRKFTVLFIIMSLLPMVVLYYFYIQIKSQGALEITEDEFNLTLTFVVLGVLLGYGTMHRVLQKLIELSSANKEALLKLLGPDQLQKLSRENNEINVLAQSFDAIVAKLEENVKSLELAKATLHSVMTKVGQGISNMQNIDTFLELILETVTEALSGNVGVLLLVNTERNILEIKTVYGAEFEKGRNLDIRLGEGSDVHFMLKDKSVEDIQKMIVDSGEGKKHPEWFRKPLLCASLRLSDTVNGVITVSGKDPAHDFTQDEHNLLSNLASQTAVAIENAKLNRDMEKTYFETISALALAVDAKDRYSRGHLDRVAKHCIMIGKKLGLDEGDLKTLRDAARLHDLGKIGIPDEILHKRESLSDQEWILMRKHTEIGESIVKPIHSLAHLCDIIRHHHEKLDGSGYPDGLRGDEITPLVRIATIADIYDALTSDRPYRKKLSSKEACKELRKMKDKIDQDIVEIFAEALEGPGAS